LKDTTPASFEDAIITRFGFEDAIVTKLGGLGIPEYNSNVIKDFTVDLLSDFEKDEGNTHAIDDNYVDSPVLVIGSPLSEAFGFIDIGSDDGA